jgi:hypothetical protein
MCAWESVRGFVDVFAACRMGLVLFVLEYNMAAGLGLSLTSKNLVLGIIAGNELKGYEMRVEFLKWSRLFGDKGLGVEGSYEQHFVVG